MVDAFFFLIRHYVMARQRGTGHKKKKTTAQAGGGRKKKKMPATRKKKCTCQHGHGAVGDAYSWIKRNKKKIAAGAIVGGTGIALGALYNQRSNVTKNKMYGAGGPTFDPYEPAAGMSMQMWDPYNEINNSPSFFD